MTMNGINMRPPNELADRTYIMLVPRKPKTSPSSICVGYYQLRLGWQIFWWDFQSIILSALKLSFSYKKCLIRAIATVTTTITTIRIATLFLCKSPFTYPHILLLRAKRDGYTLLDFVAVGWTPSSAPKTIKSTSFLPISFFPQV